MSSDYDDIKIAQPDCLPQAIEDATRQLKLVADGTWPEVLQGSCIVVLCMRLLRCVYGSDLETAAAIRKRVLDNVKFWQKVDAMTPQEALAYFKQLEREGR